MAIHHRFCVVCDKPFQILYNRPFHLATHIQGVGKVVVPAVVNHKKLHIRVCSDCNKLINQIIPNAVVKYHCDEEGEDLQ